MTRHFTGTLFEVWIKGLYGISSDEALFVDYDKIRKKMLDYSGENSLKSTILNKKLNKNELPYLYSFHKNLNYFFILIS